MSENIIRKMKKAASLFEQKAEKCASDDYFTLACSAKQAAEDCRGMKGTDLFSGLFVHCRELCKGGILPDDEKIVAFFGNGGLNGILSGGLCLAITCVLIEYASQGAAEGDEKAVADASASLRRLGETDFDLISEKLFTAGDVLSADPSGDYILSDSETKSRYRRAVALKALKSGKSEREIAEAALETAKRSRRPSGRFILSSPPRRRGYLYLVMEAVMPLAAAFAAGVLSANVWIGLLIFFPAWEIFRYPIEEASLRGVVPERFPRLPVESERVAEAQTLITVSTILPPAEKMRELEAHLEQLYLSNCVGAIKICCLGDFKGADMPSKPEDKSILKSAVQMIDRLNDRHGGGFVMAVRPREYSKTQGKFIGKERKRGAITALVRAIKGKRSEITVIHGDAEGLEKTKYIIALDGDTQLVFDSARELVAVAEHPLNKPIIRNGRVVEGYGILAPRAETAIEKKPSRFSAIMSGSRGITAYDSLSCERYQQLFGEGIFCGKGIINVDAYYELLDGSLPAESVLSHDIVEGGYLRAGFVSDVQITESFPSTAASYYKRLHRWVRGDWQNLSFIFGKNPLNFLSKYKMLDNLRRSLTPAFCLAALAVSVIIQGDRGVFLAWVSLLGAGAGSFFASFNSLRNGGFSALSRLYFSKTPPEALSNLGRGFVSMAYLAREAAVCLSAAFTALWRTLISRKNLLEWQTAAQSDGARGAGLALCIPSAVFGIMLLVFGLPVHRLAGLIILADIPLTLSGARKVKFKEKKITEKQRERLLTYAASMWDYFDELCGEKNNYLPPDNIQFIPVRKVAARTSPTNIGLMLVSFLAARDFGFISSEELFERLTKSMESVEKLEKYKGNLFNWYDTVSLKTVEPRFVSTVDSGNFLCCLTALKEGVREYSAEYPPLKSVIEKTERIIAAADLSPMYNRRRRLFHVSVSPDDGTKSGSFYDLYMSEARMTSYFAVARRQVPKNHWGATGRIPVGQGRYTGLASWTGTMFEYFMPNLFLPAPRGSLSAESLCFCLHCQRKKAGKRPFGVSESAYHAFDGNMNYSYKAHGIQSLALKRGLDREYVVSPYSSFLTLTLAPELSMKNLSRFLKMRMYGNYGFYEAVDYTSPKNKGEFSVISSYMAHHMGMSFISVANLLNGQCMQKRFMRDSHMNGAKSLLNEKIHTTTKKPSL